MPSSGGYTLLIYKLPLFFVCVSGRCGVLFTRCGHLLRNASQYLQGVWLLWGLRVRPCLIHTCHAAPMPCHDHAVLKATSQEHGTARHGHGMCELASVVQRRHVGDLPAFDFFRLPRGVPRRLLSEACQSVKLWD
jgi:hypothetical protein